MQQIVDTKTKVFNRGTDCYQVQEALVGIDSILAYIAQKVELSVVRCLTKLRRTILILQSSLELVRQATLDEFEFATILNYVSFDINLVFTKTLRGTTSIILSIKIYSHFSIFFGYIKFQIKALFFDCQIIHYRVYNK
jgi:hypothetical protein